MKKNILVKSLAVFLGIFVLYSSIIQFSGIPGGKGLNQWQENTIRLQNYVFSTVPYRCVITGSSMSARISQELLSTEDYNLSLSGGSALSGLEIITRTEKKPRCVLVEANPTLLRGVNEEEIDNIFHPVFYPFKKAIPALRDAYQPITLIGGLIKKSQKNSKKPDFRVVDFMEHIQFEKKEEKKLPSPEKLETTLNELSRLVQQLEAQGVRVYFFDTKRHSETQTGPKTRMIQESITKRLDPNLQKWLNLESFETFETEDGVHLNTSSAEKFTRLITRSLDQKLN